MHTIEVDLYMKCNRTNDGCTVLVKSILKDVSTVFVLLNENSFPDGAEVEFEAGDHLWMEIAKKPKSLRAKLWQLQRSCIHFGGEDGNGYAPKAGIICLNGERGEFETAVKFVKELVGKEGDALQQSWTMFAKFPSL
jgi:hypothetical protein